MLKEKARTSFLGVRNLKKTIKLYNYILFFNFLKQKHYEQNEKIT